ncbi:sensor histidine kinase [Subtercola boreus]|uniref:Histidine kinase/HSP90-like ATPase domain-containing protein n=1 Tax=Subtercola boreus TaxID=120213 RepID=A0A3E0WAV2_9MICO|nr:sensor histidine kinase [Subtercola boreus]RFA19068.1 hypothetical protein B7R24_13130 [Subtercola boreus]RFA19206.1 hypothetical protein B7R23_13110 [Subtercola boreus]RFA25668.1 hypothetical protein B7R25_13230 [Subtercola boreus]
MTYSSGVADGLDTATEGLAQLPADRLRLGHICAQGFGIVFALSAALNLLVPELARIASFGPALAGMAAVITGFALLPGRHSVLTAIVTYCAGLGALATFLLPGSGADNASTVATVTALASWAIPSLLVAFGHRRSLPVIAVASLIPVLVLGVVVSAPFGREVFVAIAIVGGWLAMSFAGLWLARSSRRAEAGLDRLRQGYAAERRSTETEAELRYGARVLHDTVLATLTVVAHSGVGVLPSSLRAQAAADALMLAQLRTGGIIGGRPSHATGNAEVTANRELHSTIDAWSFAHDFDIAWHGDDHVDAAPAELDALVRAVWASLENVRLHSGECRAEVTISQDARLVRAVVTDTGVGFDRDLIPRGRLGVAESIEARIASVGGSARVFSSPGHGTTVLLEVPR